MSEDGNNVEVRQEGGGVHERLIGGSPPPYPGYECNSSVAPSGFDRLVSGHCLTQTALSGDPYSNFIVGGGGETMD